MEVKCTQCGANIEITPESEFITCPYCDSRLYVEAESTVWHFYLKPRVSPEQLPGIISRELAKYELNQPVELVEAKLIFIPFWLVRLEKGILRFPASELEIEELKKFKIPVGELLPYEAEIERSYQVELPELELEEIFNLPLVERVKHQIQRVDLIHLPFYQLSYKYLEQIYSGLVDGAGGRFFAQEIPPSPSKEKDRYFMKWLALLSLIFLIEAFFLPRFWMILCSYLGTGVLGWYVIKKDLEKKGY